MEAIRTHLFDTSALVKLFFDEDGSEAVRTYFYTHAVFWTTSLCFAEMLGVLKKKLLRKTDDLTKEDYIAISDELMGLFRNEKISIEEVDITEFEIFNEVEKIVKKYSIDVSDAFQIVTLKTGFPATLARGSQTTLITGDRGLAAAARNEGLKVWDCVKEQAP